VVGVSLIWPILAMLNIFGAAVIAVLGLVFLRRDARFNRHFNENEVADALFTAMGVIYGALLAFVVFATWESFANAQNAVTSEAASLVVAYRDTETFPDPQKTEAQAAFRTYVNQVITTEWASHGTLTVHTTPDGLNALYTIYRSLPEGTMSDVELASVMDRLHDVELQRHLRHLSAEATLPWIFWPLLVLGAFIIIVFSYFFHHESLRAQAVMTGVSTALLVGVLMLIYSLNEPFTGVVTVSQTPLLHAVQQFHAIDLRP
jgi:uncharacterized membrane protein YraQ (UPF0718 family)